MKPANPKTGDRAVFLLCAAGLASVSIVAFMKLWVGGHPAQYLEIITSRSATSVALTAILFLIAAIWLLGNVVGLALAYRAREFASVRYAAIAALVGFVVYVVSCIPALELWSVSRMLWNALVWTPAVTTAAVFAMSIAWLREKRSRQEHRAAGNA
jgi:hypothetical protein